MPFFRIQLRAAAALAALVVVVVPMCAKPHHKRLAREQIFELEAQFRQAQLSSDVGMMDKLLSDDYLGIGVNGQLSTKSQQLDRMRSRNLIFTKLETSDLKVKLVGQIAIVTSLAEIDGTLEGTPLRGLFRYTRIYERIQNVQRPQSGMWRVTNFEVTKIPGGRGREVAQHDSFKPTEGRP